MDVCGGDVELTEEGTAKGASEFGTVRVVGVALRKKKWYLEVSFSCPETSIHIHVRNACDIVRNRRVFIPFQVL